MTTAAANAHVLEAAGPYGLEVTYSITTDRYEFALPAADGSGYLFIGQGAGYDGAMTFLRGHEVYVREHCPECRRARESGVDDCMKH